MSIALHFSPHTHRRFLRNATTTVRLYSSSGDNDQNRISPSKSQYSFTDVKNTQNTTPQKFDGLEEIRKSLLKLHTELSVKPQQSSAPVMSFKERYQRWLDDNGGATKKKEVSSFFHPPKDVLVEKYFHPDHMSSTENVSDKFKIFESDCGSARVQGSTSKAKRNEWTEREEVALAKAWIETLRDPIHENQQCLNWFWKRISIHFSKSVGENDRTVLQLKSKWNKMKMKVQITRFSWIYNRRNIDRRSGESDEDVLIESLQEFQGPEGKRGAPKKPFSIGAWRVLKNEEKWRRVEQMGFEFQDSAKVSKTSETNTYTRSSGSNFEPIGVDASQDDPLDDDDDILRVGGASQPKRRVKKATPTLTSSETQEHVRMVSNMNNTTDLDTENINRFRDEKLRIKEEIKQTKLKLLQKQAEALEKQKEMWERDARIKERQEKKADLRFFLERHDHLNGTQLELMLEQKREVAAHWGWNCDF